MSDPTNETMPKHTTHQLNQLASILEEAQAEAAKLEPFATTTTAYHLGNVQAALATQLADVSCAVALSEE